MQGGGFFRSRAASEALGVLLLLAGVLAALSLYSYDPRDPNLFSLTTGEAESPINWIGGFGASLSAALYQTLGFAAWTVPVILAFWGVRRFASRPLENRGSKAVGFTLLFLAVPALLSLAFGRRPISGEDGEAGGIVGRAVSDAARSRLGTTGAVLLVVTLILIAIPLATQVSLADVFFGLRVKLVALLSRLRLGLARGRDRRTKERLRRTVVTKHLEKAKREEGISLEDVPFAADDTGPFLREVPGPGKFSITKKSLGPARSSAPAVPVKKRPGPAPQQKLPISVDGYTPPPVSLLEKREGAGAVDRRVLAETGRRITEKCAEFGVEGEVVEYHPGPVVTTYEFRPAAGIKVNQVMGLSEDLALSLSAESIRIERLPGRSSVGIEVPNPGGGEIIALRDVLESEKFQSSPSLLTLALGKDIHGEPVIDDLRRMPHLLIAGTTGSGKSVAINALVTSILFKAPPDEVKLILIDPKMVELEIYAGLPHLNHPIIIEPKKAANALKWAVDQMEERFQRLSEFGQMRSGEQYVRNAEQYNAAIADPKAVAEFRAQHPEDPDLNLERMPLIVIVIDELADLMMTSPKEVEESIVRLAQKARAVGIHLVVATQRPSVDILTGVIKANLPSRIAFKVSSKIDSRVILDGNGAERLLGRGDMLFLAPGTSRLQRVHGAYVSVQETAGLVRFLKKQAKPEYDEEITKDRSEVARRNDSGDETDPLYDEAARLVIKEKMASISFLQRRMGVGFSRAGKLIDMMTRDGLLGPPRGSKPREVLVTDDYFEEVDQQPR
ncbi:MAG TPA: DNA translocase FtsK 4TM domain-containing protein [Thermoanaerobaculia bacterium]|nr:DNA translocase FtsK 4TM domain-containing protein [Thermoanaerobaculia bacterium]